MAKLKGKRVNPKHFSADQIKFYVILIPIAIFMILPVVYMANEAFKPLGETLHMLYTLDHFMGYRFALFAFSTKTPGGHADFDYFHMGIEE